MIHGILVIILAVALSLALRLLMALISPTILHILKFQFLWISLDCSQPFPIIQLPCEFRDPDHKNQDETFGRAVSIDGNYSLVGAYGEITSTGAAYVT